MSAKEIRDVAASVRARLLEIAHRQGEEFERTLVRYAVERFLYRLSRSAHADRFALKGAMLFQVWEGQVPRTTRDLDLLSLSVTSEPAVLEAVREICEVPVEPDGLRFDLEALRSEPIREGTASVGVRVRWRARLGSAVIALQVDVGLGDAVVELERVEYPTLLPMPAPHLRAYPKEATVAEKTQALVERGLANSRMKDYFDLRHLANTVSFDGERLRDALEATFLRRGTPVADEEAVGLNPAFGSDPAKQAQWSGFLRRMQLPQEPLPEVVERVRRFVGPALAALAAGRRFDLHWPPGGPWERPQDRGKP